MLRRGALDETMNTVEKKRENEAKESITKVTELHFAQCALLLRTLLIQPNAIFLQRVPKNMGKVELDAIWQDRDIRFDVNTECVKALRMKDCSSTVNCVYALVRYKSKRSSTWKM